MSWLKNYKSKECQTWFGKFIQRTIFTWIYKIYVAVALVLIASVGFSLVDEGSFLDNLFYYLYAVGLGFFIILALIFFAYAWVINPIRSLRERNRNKKGA